MYMRFVQMKVSTDRMPEMHEYYAQDVIPALHAVEGCLFAGLIRSSEHSDECVSMTLWDSQVNAEAYGKGKLYEKLASGLRPFLAASTEWKVELSKDLTLELVPVVEAPVIKSYSIESFATESAAPAPSSQPIYVRIVSPKIRPGKLEEFKKVYSTEVIPALGLVKGCRYAFLTEGGNDELLSVTIWNSREDATEYEKSGTFERLQAKLKPTFYELFQWKMGLARDEGKNVYTSEDMAVSHYQVIAGENFKL